VRHEKRKRGTDKLQTGQEDSHGWWEVTSSSRLFQTRAAEKLGHRRVRLTISNEDELQRSRRRASISSTKQTLPATWTKYEGADPWRQLHTRYRTANLSIRSAIFSQRR